MAQESTIQLKNIFLQETQFKRAVEQEKTSDNGVELKVNTSYESQANQINVYLTIDIHMKDQPDFLLKSTMVGLFEYAAVETLPFSIEDFANINAPAMLYPFLREHFASITAKAGISRILLPPLNFVGMAASNKNKED